METIEINSIEDAKKTVDVIIEGKTYSYPASFYAIPQTEDLLMIKSDLPSTLPSIIVDLSNLKVNGNQFSTVREAVVAINELSNFKSGGASSGNNGLPLPKLEFTNLYPSLNITAMKYDKNSGLLFMSGAGSILTLLNTVDNSITTEDTGSTILRFVYSELLNSMIIVCSKKVMLFDCTTKTLSAYGNAIQGVSDAIEYKGTIYIVGRIDMGTSSAVLINNGGMLEFHSTSPVYTEGYFFVFNDNLYVTTAGNLYRLNIISNEFEMIGASIYYRSEVVYDNNNQPYFYSSYNNFGIRRIEIDETVKQFCSTGYHATARFDFENRLYAFQTNSGLQEGVFLIRDVDDKPQTDIPLQTSPSTTDNFSLLKVHNGDFYVSTPDGVYKQISDLEFEFVNSVQLSNSASAIVDKKTYAAGKDGLYLIEEAKTYNVRSSEGEWVDISKVPVIQDILTRLTILEN